MSHVELADPVMADQIRNKAALIGASVMNIVLAAAYFVEVLKGVRSTPSYLIFFLMCVIPCIIGLILYRQDGASPVIRYVSTVGFALLYTYVMFTTSTSLAFCYVVVFLLIILVYADKKISIGVSVYALVINIARIGYLAASGKLVGTDITDAEITVACILLSCVFAVMSVNRIAQIDEAVIAKADADKKRSEELLELTLKVADAMAQNVNDASESTVVLRDSTETTQNAMENLTNGTSETVSAIQVQQQQTKNIHEQVQGVSDMTDTLMETTAQTANNITLSKEVMQNLVQQVTISQESSIKVADSMSELKEYADKMQDIVSLISSVASQTSLLSLNASIEAARAGEAGRGFAVVAQEISNLAGQTNSATGDINQLIANISQSVESVTASVNELFESNQHQNEYISSTADYFDMIEENTTEISSGMTELKHNVDAVSESNNQIIKSIENVSAITQEVTASAEATLSDCKTNLDNVNAIAAVMQQLHANAEELRRSH